MRLSEFKSNLKNINELRFQLPNGSWVPDHFHVTEVGAITKHFIDCGGTERKENVISLQLWEANDYNHRLHPEKLEHIVNLSEEKLNLQDAPIEVEYQGETIQKFALTFTGEHFNLEPLKTDCLAKENCGIPVNKPNVKLHTLETVSSTCDPNSGCC